MPATIEALPRLIEGIPKGAWVALSHDQDRVVVYGAELEDVLRRSREAGENDPVVIRVPLTDSAAFL